MFIHTLVKYTYVCRKILIIVRRQTFYEDIPEERERERKKKGKEKEEEEEEEKGNTLIVDFVVKYTL